ncbi:MAG TPA: hypothetical protein VII18_02220 [Mycobacterium sp.]
MQLGKVALMGKLESQHVAAEPEGEQLVIIDLPVGFDERENTEYLRVRLYQDGYPIPRKHWAGLCGEQVQKLVALMGLRLWVAKWPSGPGPCAKVTETVFYTDRTFGEPMKGIHDALLALTRRQRRP